MSKGKLLVISGPSGVGKGRIVGLMLENRKDCALSISCTTRAPREDETDGVNYFFITREQFEKMIAENGFLEYSEHYSNLYGTPRAFVEEKLKEGSNVILEIEVDGALNVKKTYKEAILVMIAPPDKQALYDRLRGRKSETEEEIERRVQRSEYELSKIPYYDYTIINDKLDEAVEQVVQILEQGDRK